MFNQMLQVPNHAYVMDNKVSSTISIFSKQFVSSFIYIYISNPKILKDQFFFFFFLINLFIFKYSTSLAFLMEGFIQLDSISHL